MAKGSFNSFFERWQKKNKKAATLSLKAGSKIMFFPGKSGNCDLTSLKKNSLEATKISLKSANGKILSKVV